MFRLFRQRCDRGLLIGFIVGATFALPACTPVGTPAASLTVSATPSVASPPSATSIPSLSPPVSTALVTLQQNVSLAASFRAMVPRNINGNLVDYATEYFVPALPIIWTGASFRGQLNERGPGEDIVDNVSGLVSPDGSMLVSFLYSRLVTGGGPGSGVFYQVVLKNLPISPTGTFQGTGSSVQPYVVNVKSGHNLDNVAINWSNTAGGQLPSLTVTFSK